MGLSVTAKYQEPNHQWMVLNNKYWMIESGNPIPDPEITKCGANMIEVEGDRFVDPDNNSWGNQTIEALQKTTCLKWIERKIPRDKCQKYDRERWVTLSQKFKTQHMHFCIDKYEAPNVAGQSQIIMVSLNEAQKICNYQNKRLCDEHEWEFACGGSEAVPYGYGYERDATACVIDKPWRLFHTSAFYPRNTERLAKELDWLWQSEPSGSRPRCHTKGFNVMDLIGSEDEIVLSIRPGTSKLALHGGYHSGVRNRCIAATRSHDENHTFYNETFRCCNDYIK